MELIHKLEASFGAALTGGSVLATIVHEIYPVLSFIAVACGAILGLHGVWCLITHKHRKQYDHYHPHEGDH